MRETGWATTSSREVYANRWIRLREDEVIRPDGGAGVYGVLEMRNPAVFVVAVDEDDRVVLIELYRYTTGLWSTEVPAGSTDGEDPLAAAQRELAEETGLLADEWTHLGELRSLDGVANAPEHVYLARGLREVPHDDGEERAAEGITEVRRVPWPEVLGLVGDGTITDAETVAALMLAVVRLGRVS